jgi:hypothetical protein
MVARGQLVHVLAHHGVPQQRLLAQHRALGAPGGARRVDDEQRRGEIRMRVAAVAARFRDQQVERGQVFAREVEADSACLRQRSSERRDNLRERLFDHQRLHRGIGEDEHLLRDGEAPVERHQHGAEPRAGVEQHEIIGMIGGENRHPVAARDAKLRF